MKQRILLAAVALGLIGAATSWWLNRDPSSQEPTPSLASLQVFPLAVAPSTTPGTWSSNPPSPQVSAILQQVQISQSNLASNETAAGDFKTVEQYNSFRQLQQEAGPSLRAYLRPERQTPIQVQAEKLFERVDPANTPAAHMATSVAFLEAYSPLLLMQNAPQELACYAQEPDPLGGAHLRYVQTYAGLPVWPAEVGIHVNADGHVDLFDGAYIETPQDLSTTPTITAGDAQNGVPAMFPERTVTTSKAELIIYARFDHDAQLAWKMSVSTGAAEAWWLMVDAHTGQEIDRISQVATESVAGAGIDAMNVTRPLSVWRESSTYYMLNAAKPMFNPLLGSGIILVTDAGGTGENNLQKYYVTSPLAFSWNNSHAVSAAFNFSETYDYYLNRFGRNSYNGRGSNLTAVVRINGFNNAYWNGEIAEMGFGAANNFAACLDVIGHEVTHGVCSSIGTNGGVLLYRNQPGALNEAFSDFFGEMIEARTFGSNDWLLGSQLSEPARSMKNPPAFEQPARMSQYVFTTQDKGGVHINSGIINYALYLLSEGLTNAIGKAATEQIVYRCLTLHMKPLSEFIDARLGCIAAAEALFGVGSRQVLKTAEAFDAVELYAAPASAPQPTNVNAAVNAPDSHLFIREHWFYDRDDLYRSSTGDPAAGTALVNTVAMKRPSVTGDGTNIFFVGVNQNLYSIRTDGSGFTDFNIPGQVHSVAVSPNGRFVAFVFVGDNGQPTNQIVLLDLDLQLTAGVTLVTPTPEGPSLTNILYADSLSFSPDGRILSYDAVSRTRGVNGATRGAWSVFALDTTTLQQFVVVPPLPDFNVGNPSFGKTSDRFLVMDAVYTNGSSVIFVADLPSGNIGTITATANGAGHPVFNGDDTEVWFSDRDTSVTSNRSVYRHFLNSSKTGSVSSRQLMRADAKLAVVYRKGQFKPINNAPFISFSAPADNSTFIAPATITLSVNATDVEGDLVGVGFYANEILLSVDTNFPYSTTVTNVPAGRYSFYARAFDNYGASGTTGPLRLTVRPSANVGTLNRQPDLGFEFTLSVTQTGLYRLEASTNLVDWVQLGTVQATTNIGYLDRAATNLPQRFYRLMPTP